MQTLEECLLMYRRTLRQLLYDNGIASNPAVDDEWILNKIAELVSKSRTNEQSKHANALHPSHVTRMSDASSFDEICVNCGATDEVPGGWGKLAEPCLNPPKK